MGAFYLVASVFAGADVFRTVAFRAGGAAYTLTSLLTRWSALLLAGLIVMEACLLGCNTRLQIVAVLVPIVLLIAACPSDA